MRILITTILCSAVMACGVETTPKITKEVSNTGSSLLLPLPADTNTVITATDLTARIKPLSDDIFEGRGPGSDAGEASADWIAAEMARIGLKPGVNGSYLQTVEMVEQVVDMDNSYLKLSINGEERPLNITDEAVFWTKQQAEAELSFDGSELVFVGYGVVAPEYDWNDYEGLDVAGKTVVMLVNDPGFGSQNPELFRGNAMTYYGRWTYKYEEAARQGATAAIVIHETAPASYGWNTVANSWSGTQADLVRNNGGADRTLLEGWFTHDLAREIFAASGQDYDVLKAAAHEAGFKPVALEGITASAKINQTVKISQSSNVIGVIEGSQTPDEYVAYIAHWDHIGKASNASEGEDVIYNGAVDNATGIAGILEVAEAMVIKQPRRSVMFIAVTLEESGLLGSAYFAENPTVPLDRIVAGINIDAMLPVGPTHDMVVIGYGASQLEDLLLEVLLPYNRVLTPDPSPEAGYFYRSDHISLAKKGVPMLYADGGFDHREKGLEYGRQIGEQYRINDYHQPSDEWADDWDMRGMAEDVGVLYQLGLNIAQSEDWPQWYEGSEFRAIRDLQKTE